MNSSIYGKPSYQYNYFTASIIYLPFWQLPTFNPSTHTVISQAKHPENRTTMASENGSWANVEERTDDQKISDTSSTPGSKQSKTSKTDDLSNAGSDIICRIEFLEETVRNLKDLVIDLAPVQKYRTKREEPQMKREEVLEAWSKAPLPPTQDYRHEDATHEGDVRADIRAIAAKEMSDPATAERWKGVLLDRYGLHWEGISNDLGLLDRQMIRMFNIRARVLHGWDSRREEILMICDDWIGRWGTANVQISSGAYRELCRLYYA
jgi:hypothetical protein